MTSLNLIHLAKTYPSVTGDIVALCDVNLRVESGQLLALLGASGSGKTTLLRLIAGLVMPTGGDICFDGQSVLKTPPEKRGAVVVFQDHLLFPFMTVRDNIAFGLKIKHLSRAEIRRKISEVLEVVQMTGFECRYPDELSGGQRQRVALARALAVQPRVLLLDEPFSNLDPNLREELRGEIGHLQKTFGITTVFVTHDQTEALLIADRVALLMDGKIAQCGEPRLFYEQPANAKVARFFGGANLFPAHKRGKTIETAFGSLLIEPNGLPDGPVQALIRPESILLGTNGVNTLTATVQSWLFQGERSRGTVVIGNTFLEMSSPPHVMYAPGDIISLHFDHVWLVPSEES